MLCECVCGGGATAASSIALTKSLRSSAKAVLPPFAAWSTATSWSSNFCRLAASVRSVCSSRLLAAAVVSADAEVLLPPPPPLPCGPMPTAVLTIASGPAAVATGGGGWSDGAPPPLASRVARAAAAYSGEEEGEDEAVQGRHKGWVHRQTVSTRNQTSGWGDGGKALTAAIVSATVRWPLRRTTCADRLDPGPKSLLFVIAALAFATLRGSDAASDLITFVRFVSDGRSFGHKGWPTHGVRC